MLAAKYYPRGLPPFPWQSELINQIIAGWSAHDVIVITAPTAAGKTWIMQAVANWRASCGEEVTLLEPTNILVAQVAQWGGTEMYGKDHYPDAKVMRAAVEAIKNAKVRVMNPFTMASHKLQTSVVCADEAHTLISQFEDSKDVRLAQSDYEFPSSLRTLEDVVAFCQGWLRDNPGHVLYPRMIKGLHEILRMADGASVSYYTRTQRNPDLILHIQANGAHGVSQWVLPAHRVRKVLLFSATINESDVAALGLGNRRALYLTCPSPIDPVRRPLLYTPVVHMGSKYRKYAIPKLARWLRDFLATHPDNGLIHCTYDTARMLKPLLEDNPRLLWHTKANKARVLSDFRRESGKGAVLVASGLYEGIDLIDDAARWQIISSIPYPNLRDARTRSLLDNDPAGYAWNTIKPLVQAYGRVCRGTGDFGETYVVDSQFERLLRDHRDLFPDYFLNAITK